MLKNSFHFFREFSMIRNSNITFIFLYQCGCFRIMRFIITNSMINYTILITTLGCKGWGVPVTNLDQLAER